jgi:hypothetical protein
MTASIGVGDRAAPREELRRDVGELVRLRRRRTAGKERQDRGGGDGKLAEECGIERDDEGEKSVGREDEAGFHAPDVLSLRYAETM